MPAPLRLTKYGIGQRDDGDGEMVVCTRGRNYQSDTRSGRAKRFRSRRFGGYSASVVLILERCGRLQTTQIREIVDSN